MDQVALLGVNLAGGWRLIGRLVAGGVPVSAALWARREDEEDWYFYVESPNQDEAVRQIFDGLRESPEWGLDMFTVNVVTPGGAMMKAAAARAAPGRVVPFRGGSLGGTYLSGAIIYPPWEPGVNPVA